MGRPIYIEFESFLRDFDYRFSLSLELALKNLDIYFGHIYFLNRFTNYSPTGSFYFAKDCLPEKVDFYKRRKNKGYLNLVLDEEANSVYQMPLKYQNYRFNKFTFHSVDHIFFGSKQEYETLQEIYKCDKKAYFCLNPRFTFFKYFDFYQKEKEKIINKYGDFILVPLSHSIKHVLGKEGREKEISEMKKWIKANINVDFNEKAFLQSYKAYRENNLRLVKLINQYAAKNPKEKFIIRVHPSDLNENSEQILDNKSANVFFEREGSIVPYLLACKFVVQSNCTTALDAFFAGKNSINFQDKNIEIHKIYSNSLSQKYGIQVSDSESLYISINNLIRDYGNNLSSILEEELYTNPNDFEYLLNKLFEIHKLNAAKKPYSYFEGAQFFVSFVWANLKRLKREDDLLIKIEALKSKINFDRYKDLKISLVGDMIVKITNSRNMK